MGQILCTFSGQLGDVLWSMPTVREQSRVSNLVGIKVDFATMPCCRSLVPLLKEQPYINEAFVLEEWEEKGRPFGCQPWLSPNFPERNDYDFVLDLTYRCHPYGTFLANWIFREAGWNRDLSPDDIPFLEVPRYAWSFGEDIPFPVVAVAFNDMFADKKQVFLAEVKHRLPTVAFIEVQKMDWIHAASVIRSAMGFLGCRSSNYVLAHGLGKRVLVFEPHPARCAPVFDFPIGKETEVRTADQVKEMVDTWLVEWKEAKHESAVSDTR